MDVCSSINSKVCFLRSFELNLGTIPAGCNLRKDLIDHRMVCQVGTVLALTLPVSTPKFSDAHEPCGLEIWC